MDHRSIALVTDAWKPQVNGVVNTLANTCACLERLGHRVRVIHPGEHRTFPCPTYPEIRLALMPARRLRRQLEACNPDRVHIATEGPLGVAARAYCLGNGFAFTTSYHTQFPEYLRQRLPIPVDFSYGVLRRFHGAAARTMVATASQEARLIRHGFTNIVRWCRGVDTDLFTPEEREPLDVPRPLFVYAGRVAVEKNIGAFLQLDLPGTKCVIGDGPALAGLRRSYPEVLFTGYRFGKALARHIAAADVFVFPSRSDTFGLVLLEAVACGVPVAAYPVTGPLDVVKAGETGIMDEDLRTAALQALELDRGRCRTEALGHTWTQASHAFLDNLVPAQGTAKAAHRPPAP
jgi:glycosyltransferase involved in cell wall biosynthesis